MAFFRFDFARTRSLFLSLAIAFGASIFIAPLHVSAAPSTSPTDVLVQLSDVQTFDQDGRSLRFASDVIGDRIVVVNFIYTSCKTLCPISSALFANLQELLVQKGAAQDARLVSITLDPHHDTPPRLKAYARQYDAGERWLWITGSEETIAEVTKGFGASGANFREHDSLTIVGDAKTAHWTVFNALPGPEKLLAEVERLASARAQASARR